MQLICWNVSDFHEDESVLKGFRKLLSTSISFCWVLGCKDSEVGVSLNHFLSFNNMKLSVVIEKSIQGFKNFGWCQVELIKNDPVAFPDSLNKNSLLEDKLSILVISRWDIRSQVLLNISVHVIVDPNHLVVGDICQVLHC